MYNTDYISTIGYSEDVECIFIQTPDNKEGITIYSGKNIKEIFIEIQVALTSGKKIYKIPKD